MRQRFVTDIMMDAKVGAAVAGRRIRHRRQCIVCERWFECVRSDAMTCSATCRQHLRRARLGRYRFGLPWRLAWLGRSCRPGLRMP